MFLFSLILTLVVMQQMSFYFSHFSSFTTMGSKMTFELMEVGHDSVFSFKNLLYVEANPVFSKQSLPVHAVLLAYPLHATHM